MQTASAYLNNLLLARGLLRNGKSIDFARPDKASGGTDATMTKVINLVHDLVLRRDVRIACVPWNLYTNNCPEGSRAAGKSSSYSSDAAFQ